MAELSQNFESLQLAASLAMRAAHSRQFDASATILFIGFRGAGKVRRCVYISKRYLTICLQTTLGLIASTFLRRVFIDADKLFESLSNGRTVRDMVAAEGMAAFRQQESALLQRLLAEQSKGAVIALGAGIVESEANRNLLRAYAATQGPVVHVYRNIDDVLYYLRRQAIRSTWATVNEAISSGALNSHAHC